MRAYSRLFHYVIPRSLQAYHILDSFFSPNNNRITNGLKPEMRSENARRTQKYKLNQSFIIANIVAPVSEHRTKESHKQQYLTHVTLETFFLNVRFVPRVKRM